MKLRRYMGKDNQEAMLKVKMDLGSEAVILNTRKVRKKGVFKFFSKPLVEVLAAIDEYSVNQKVASKKKKSREVEEEEYEEKKNLPKNNEKNEEISKNKRNLEEKEEKLNHLENKVNSMEKILQKVYVELTEKKPRDLLSTSVNQEPLDNTNNSKVYELFYKNLVKNEVEPEIAKEIIDKLRENMVNVPSVVDTATHLFTAISEILGKPETIKLKEDGKPTIVIFIGPTGVGKTTTLAKIAASYSLNKNKEVGLITADTYRIAAVDQLKTYAEILGIPVSVVYTHSEIKGAIDNYKDKDIILIDTAGRSYKNKNQFEELKVLVKETEPDETYLVLSTTTSVKNCKEILNNYSFVENFKIIFTKIDETPVTGIILNAMYHTKRCLSYITTGQSVPDDIEIADTEKLSKNLLGSIQK